MDIIDIILVWLFIALLYCLIKIFFGPKYKASLTGKRNLNSQGYLEEAKEIKRKKEEKAKADAENIITAYKNYIDKFCEIAEIEISSLDEWGDENWDVLPRLKKECIFRIARSIHRRTKGGDMTKFSVEDWFNSNRKDEDDIEIIQFSDVPLWAQRLFNEDLNRLFLEYHTKRKSKGKKGKISYNRMSGREFENYIGGMLMGLGYNVSGTPATGDQGADLIVSKNNKVYVVQVKRSSGSVGNKAIQEVVAAKNYYNGDVVVVVTNSRFTTSAKELARKNKAVLIDKSNLSNIDYLLSKA